MSDSITVLPLENDSCLIEIHGDMTINQVDDLQRALLKRLPDMKHLELDLSNIGDFDTAGMQLLLALFNTIQQQGISYKVTQLGHNISNFISLIQLQHIFVNEAD